MKKILVIGKVPQNDVEIANYKAINQMVEDYGYEIIGDPIEYGEVQSFGGYGDLFSGVGSFGIECLSRGTEKVTFVENYSGVLPILKKNLSNIKSHNSYVIIEKDIINGNLFFEFNEKFDLIFLDPPFKDKNLKNILTSIAKEKLLNTNGIIIIHRHKSEKDTIPGDFKIIEEKKYGLSKIIFLN